MCILWAIVAFQDRQANPAMQMMGCLLRARLRGARAARTPTADCNVEQTKKHWSEQ